MFRITAARGLTACVLFAIGGATTGFGEDRNSTVGRLNEHDASRALSMSVGLMSPELRLDMDNDGDVTSRDATLILQGLLEERSGIADAERQKADGAPKVVPPADPARAAQEAANAGAGAETMPPRKGTGNAQGPNAGTSQGAHPGTPPGVGPETQTGSHPDATPGTNAGAMQGANPGASPGANADTMQGANPGASPGTNAGAMQGANPGSSPGATPGATAGTNRSATPGVGPAAGTLSGAQVRTPEEILGSPDPWDNPRVQQAIDSFLSTSRPMEPGLHWTAWAQAVGPHLSAAAPPDHGTQSRFEWLWHASPIVQSARHGTMRQFIERMLRGEPTEVAPASTDDSTGDLVVVPDLRGMKSGDARFTLKRAGLAASVQPTNEAPPTADLAYTVKSQDPARDAKAQRGSTVVLQMYGDAKVTPQAAADARSAPVPALSGMKREDALAALRKAGGLEAMVDGDKAAPSEDRVGMVYDQFPKAGAPRPADGIVVLYVYGHARPAVAQKPPSDAGPSVAKPPTWGGAPSQQGNGIPNVVGMTKDEAARALGQVGILRLQTQTDMAAPSADQAGRVYHQDPQPGGRLPDDGVVALAVYGDPVAQGGGDGNAPPQGQPPDGGETPPRPAPGSGAAPSANVPSVIGMSKDQALAALNAAGVEHYRGDTSLAASDRNRVGQVYWQSPLGGSPVPDDSTVVLYLFGDVAEDKKGSGTANGGRPAPAHPEWEGTWQGTAKVASAERFLWKQAGDQYAVTIEVSTGADGRLTAVATFGEAPYDFTSKSRVDGDAVSFEFHKSVDQEEYFFSAKLTRSGDSLSGSATGRVVYHDDNDAQGRLSADLGFTKK